MVILLLTFSVRFNNQKNNSTCLTIKYNLNRCNGTLVITIKKSRNTMIITLYSLPPNSPYIHKTSIQTNPHSISHSNLDTPFL